MGYVDDDDGGQLWFGVISRWEDNGSKVIVCVMTSCLVH